MSRSTIAVFLFGMLAATPSAVRAAVCLGSDPEAADDAGALAAVRAAVDAACPCASFDHTPRKRHINYLICAARTLNAAVKAKTLRRACKATAMYPVSHSTCGRQPNTHKPCVVTGSTGAVSCKILPDRLCKGSRAAVCDFYQNCLDAGDTTQDGKVDAGDSGACNAPPQCSNPPTDNGTACDDGNACTQTDTCQNGACVGSNPVTYSALDQCHDAGTCNPASGACSISIKPDGSTCDGGLNNSYPKTCSNGICGACAPSGVCQCTGDSQCPSGETCTAGFCSSTQQACAFDLQCPSLVCSLTSSPAPRYVDNGDGTITDRQTCLVWEKKDAFDGTPASCPGGASCGNPHDADNVYTWGDTNYLSNGSAFTEFLADLNGASFAGHNDWRLPGPELQGLVDLAAPGCGSGGPCVASAFDVNRVPTCSGTDPSCSCTGPFAYWMENSASVVDFSNGSTGSAATTSGEAVRAVRGCTANFTVPAVKARCINECALRCGDDGQCIFGCLVGQDFTTDRCYSDCNGFSPRCLDSCLQTIDCIGRSASVCTP